MHSHASQSVHAHVYLVKVFIKGNDNHAHMAMGVGKCLLYVGSCTQLTHSAKGEPNCTFYGYWMISLAIIFKHFMYNQTKWD